MARPTLPPDWKNIPRVVKSFIRDRLYRHQFGLCGYCEGSLGELGRHIEHVEPKGGVGGNSGRTYDYTNLIASCQGDTDRPKAAGQDGSCGHFKDQQIQAKGTFFIGDFVSPRETGCDGLFNYLLDGRIVPKAATGTVSNQRAAYTIQLVGLDCNRLKNRRRAISAKLIRQIHRFKDQPVVLQQLTNHYLGAHVDSSGNAVLLPFYSTRKQRLGL
jgi:uncharacterized protein (TIGR02646 family)